VITSVCMHAHFTCMLQKGCAFRPAAQTPVCACTACTQYAANCTQPTALTALTCHSTTMSRTISSCMYTVARTPCTAPPHPVTTQYSRHWTSIARVEPLRLLPRQYLRSTQLVFQCFGLTSFTDYKHIGWMKRVSKVAGGEGWKGAFGCVGVDNISVL
jgi:hypothetical protein